MYRDRFETIIKTEGEDSGAGNGYSQPQRPVSASYHHAPPPAHMTGTPGVLPGNHPPGIADEKQQMWKNEKGVNTTHVV